MYAGASAPAGWLMCDGSAVSRTTYASLFTAISTTWGIGDNSTTFNLPDLRESAPVGVGTFTAVGGTTHGSLTAHDAFTLAQFKDDQEQSHIHGESYANSGSSGVRVAGASAGNTYTVDGYTFTAPPSIDGANGTPRVGTVTRGKRIGINFIIKA